ncbi:MAG: hypothetical protein ACRCWM_01460 [Sarcina sp.]
MNKLELLYKVVKEVKSKNEFNALIKANIIKNGEQIVSIENDVYKNCEKKEGVAQIEGYFISPEGKVEVSQKVDLAALKAKKKAYMMEMKEKMAEKEDFQNMKRKCKLTKMMFGLKVLNELELSQEENFNVLTLDMAVIKEMIAEKMGAKKCECDHEKKMAIMQEMGIPKELVALHFMAMKEIHEGFDSSEAKIYVDEKNIINKVIVSGKSNSNDDTFKIEIVSK